MPHSVFYIRNHHLVPFGLGSAVMALEEEGHSVSKQINVSIKTVFVEQLPYLLGFANKGDQGHSDNDQTLAYFADLDCSLSTSAIH